MSEKFRKVVNAPHKAFGRARKKLQNMTPENKTEHVLRATGVGIAGLSQFLLWAGKYVTLDNHLLRKLEEILAGMKVGKNKAGNDKKLSAFMKKNPNFSAHLIYYLVAVMSFGGVKYGPQVPEKAAEWKQQAKEWVVGADGTSDDAMTLDMQKTMDPKSDDFINQCIALENITCIPLIYTETYRAVPKVQAKENVWTHGFGMTWSRDKNGKMTVRDYADTKANRKAGNTPHKPQVKRTKDADLEETQQFLRDHIYGKIKRYMKRPITQNEFFGLCVAGYQLEGHVDDICANLNNAKTPQQVADAFITPTMYKYGGTPKRRWVCGMLAAGYITMQDILNADVDAFYKPDLNTFIRRGHFVCDANTIKYVLGLKKNGNTRDVVKNLADGKLAMQQLGGQLEVAPTRVVVAAETEDSKRISESMAELVNAQQAYNSGDYSKAAKLYEKAITQDPDNMQAYSDLALVYKKIGDKSKRIDDYERAVSVVVNCNRRMNANGTLLMDHDIKASSYYNAALARTEIGDIYAARGNKEKAQENYVKALKNFKNALDNCELGDGDPEKIKIYQRAINSVQAKMGRKKTTFVDASKTVKKSLDTREGEFQTVVAHKKRGSNRG